jgi:Tfp pilus assembly protein PilF
MKKRAFLFLAAATVLLVTACNKTGLERTALKTAEEYHTRGLEYLENDDYDNAIADYKVALQLDPNNTDLPLMFRNARRTKEW